MRDVLLFHSEGYGLHGSSGEAPVDAGVGVGVGVLVESGCVREALAGAGVGAVGGESDTEVPREQRVASLQDILRYLHTLSVPSAQLPKLSSSSYIQFLDPHALHAAVERQPPLVGL